MDVRNAVESMLRPEVVLDILQNFTDFATDKKHRRIKIICRYQQYEGTNLIVKRVVEGQIKKGLISSITAICLKKRKDRVGLVGDCERSA